MEVFPWGVLGDISLGAVVVGFVFAILAGKLVPVNIVREIKDDRDLWRDTALTREDSLKVALETVSEVHDASKMILDIVKELRVEADGHQGSDTQGQ